MVASELFNEDILSLGMRADDARRAHSASSRVFYQRVHVLALHDLSGAVTIPAPATEVRILDMPPTLEEALTCIRVVKEASGTRRVAAFSAADVIDRAKTGRGRLSHALTELRSAGLDDFAEMPVDTLADPLTLIGEARACGIEARRLTVANPFSDRKAEILERIRLCAGVPGGLQRVNPLPRHIAVDKPTTGYDDVRTVALTRLALVSAGSAMPFVEVDWTLYGPKLAQVALTFGADFLDAVAATSDDSLGRRRGTVEDVERNIRAAGFQPEEYRPVLDGAGHSDRRQGTE